MLFGRAFSSEVIPVRVKEMRPNKDLEPIQEKWVPVFRPNGRPNKNLEPIQEKWVPVFRPNGRPNKDLERFRDSVKFGNALDKESADVSAQFMVLRGSG